MDKTEKINNLREELIKIVINLEIDYNNPYDDGRTIIKFDDTNRLPSNITTIILDLFKKHVNENVASFKASKHNERIRITITTFEKDKIIEQKNENITDLTCWYKRELFYKITYQTLFFIFIFIILIAFIIYKKFDKDFITELQTTLSNLNSVKPK